jgi:RNA recognition motif-containing protein
MTIYVGNLSKTTNEEALKTIFSKFGEVREVRFIKDRESGEPRGYGFIEMIALPEAMQAIEELNGMELEGQQITVMKAHSRRGGRPQRNRMPPRRRSNNSTRSQRFPRDTQEE